MGLMEKREELAHLVHLDLLDFLALEDNLD